MAAGHRRHHQLPLLLAWALAACPPLLGQRAGGPSSSPLPGCILHEALLARIKKDLEPWQKLGGIGKELIREGSTVCEENSGHCNQYMRVLIHNNKVYCLSLPWRNALHMEGHANLLELVHLASLVPLPNMTLLISLNDDPPDFNEPEKRQGKPPIPVFSIAKGFQHPAMLIPNTGHDRCMNGVDKMARAVAEGLLASVPWEQRRPVAFGRFSPFCPYWELNIRGAWIQSMLDGEERKKNVTPPPGMEEGWWCVRQKLVTVSQENPEVVNASFKGFTSPAEHARYKYLLSPDGYSISTKLEKFMWLGSVVIKQESPRYAWFYHALQPGVHYLPFNHTVPNYNSTTDLLDVIKWLREHDSQARQIAANALQFAVTHLTRWSRLCYWKHLLEEYGKLFTYSPDCSHYRVCVPAEQELALWSHTDPYRCDTLKQLRAIHGPGYDPGPKPAEERLDQHSPYGYNHSATGFWLHDP